jgi:acetyl esterase/lipase
MLIKRLAPALPLSIILTCLASARGAETTRIRDVVYGRAAGMALTFDVLKPEKPSGVGVLFMVSGGFSSDMAFIGSDFLPLSIFQPFIDRGQTVFFVGHGSQPKFTVEEIVPFIRRAVRFIRTHAEDYGVDPNRLGIMGISSGGYLSIMMGATGAPGDASAADPVDRASSNVEAVACLCPPADLVNFGEDGESFVEFKPVEFVWHTIPVKDRPKDEQVKVLTELSPISHVTSDDAPTLIITGDHDELVPHHQSERFIAKLKENGVPAELIIREGAGHTWPEIPQDFAILADWFDKHLKASDK